MRAVLGLPAATPYISCFHETLKNMTNPQALALLNPLCVHLDSPCGFNPDTPQVSPLPKCGPGEPSDSSFQELMEPRTFQLLRPQTGGWGQLLFLIQTLHFLRIPVGYSRILFSHPSGTAAFLLLPPEWGPMPPTHSSYFGIWGDAMSYFAVEDLGSSSLVDLSNSMEQFWETQNPPLEKAMAPHSSTLAWKIPWTEEPGRLQSTGSLRVGHD